MKDLNEYTDVELKDELQRRKEEAEHAKQAKREAANELFLEHIDTFLLFTPHTRTSCTGEDSTVNEGRCERCSLNHFKELQRVPPYNEVEVSVRITEPGLD